MYHAAWAWAGMTPFRGTKLVAGYFGGTRAPLAISWPQQIKVDAQARAQFHHVNDIVPTIYDVVGRSEEHTSELQTLMRISYADFCLTNKQEKIVRRDNTATTRTTQSDKA